MYERMVAYWERIKAATVLFWKSPLEFSIIFCSVVYMLTDCLGWEKSTSGSGLKRIRICWMTWDTGSGSYKTMGLTVTDLWSMVTIVKSKRKYSFHFHPFNFYIMYFSMGVKVQFWKYGNGNMRIRSYLIFKAMSC